VVSFSRFLLEELLMRLLYRISSSLNISGRLFTQKCMLIWQHRLDSYLLIDFLHAYKVLYNHVANALTMLGGHQAKETIVLVSN